MLVFMNGLPEKFLERMKARLGAEYGDYLAALDAPPVKGLHINTARCAVSVADGALPGLEKLPFGDGCRLVAEGRPTAHPYYAAGLYYMQEPSAMLPVSALAGLLPDGARVLDMCAAPGGKTSMLARMPETGLLVSNEIERSRALVLRENVVRMGYANVLAVSMRPDRAADAFGGFFDAAVVDAPCSGEGMMRKEPQAAANWSEANVRACAARQREILRSADACLKEGGLLLYSTCTFSPEEDEGAAEYALSLGYEPVSAPESIRALGRPAGCGYIFYPHAFRGEGQFFCLLRKTGAARPEAKPGARCRPASRAELALVSDVMDVSGLGIASSDGMLFVPALRRELPCLVNGVMLGRAEKGRFTPAHQAFHAYGGRFRALELDVGDERVADYLAGREIAGEARGWVAVTAGGYALGGGKGSGGVVKNHYPKSLREERSWNWA